VRRPWSSKPNSRPLPARNIGLTCRRSLMADHTTRRTTTDQLEEAISSLSEKHSELASKVDVLCDRLTQLATQPTTSSPPPPPRHPVKLDIPRFNGHDPLGWIFKITQFFYYQGTPNDDRITVTSFYLDGPALSWFQWMHKNGFITSWQAMLHAIETRFAPSFYDDPRGTLFKLSQRGSRLWACLPCSF